ncbi:HAD family hydrolase [Sodalinema gerasimenkoae]|uniref:HAD family hydrolase n=1 Tax=Sodalinema gerasimenkoae TaxID=2862348 RepID=UPI00135A2B50|nr:HAD family hydrolase [Sodalinema gerasimenkoae]
MKSTLFALDFDGVLCNGLIEYFQTAWRAYCQVWSPSQTTPPEDLATSFYRLRPVVETGWEMPVVLRSRLLGYSEQQILEDWREVCQTVVEDEQLNPSELANAVDGVRDRWIRENVDNWLSLHRFYPGVIEQLHHLQTAEIPWVIITTKEGRFVRALLAGQGIEFQRNQLFGKEVKLPKHEILSRLLNETPYSEIIFIEDRLNTLYSVAEHEDLNAVKLYLADWGYNTESMRNMAKHDERITVISLQQFEALIVNQN